jgi:hypothetical protein
MCDCGKPISVPRPIGIGNRENRDLRVNADKAHGGWPSHVDVVVPIRDARVAHKIRVDGYGNIISDEIT